jgi:hypothetical protein
MLLKTNVGKMSVASFPTILMKYKHLDASSHDVIEYQRGYRKRGTGLCGSEAREKPSVGSLEMDSAFPPAKPGALL